MLHEDVCPEWEMPTPKVERMQGKGRIEDTDEMLVGGKWCVM
jgi:hypothetical protein